MNAHHSLIFKSCETTRISSHPIKTWTPSPFWPPARLAFTKRVSSLQPETLSRADLFEPKKIEVSLWCGFVWRCSSLPSQKNIRNSVDTGKICSNLQAEASARGNTSKIDSKTKNISKCTDLSRIPHLSIARKKSFFARCQWQDAAFASPAQYLIFPMHQHAWKRWRSNICKTVLGLCPLPKIVSPK